MPLDLRGLRKKWPGLPNGVQGRLPFPGARILVIFCEPANTGERLLYLSGDGLPKVFIRLRAQTILFVN
jgi:hypothetical protein